MVPSSHTTAEPSTSGQRTSVAAGLLGKNPEHNTPLTTSQKVLNLLAALAQLVAQTPAHHFLAPTVDADMKLGNGAKASGPTCEALRDAVLPAGSGETHSLDLLPAEQHLLALVEAPAAGASCLLLDESTAGLDARR